MKPRRRFAQADDWQAFISASSGRARYFNAGEDKVTVGNGPSPAPATKNSGVRRRLKYGEVATWLAITLAEFNQIVTDDGLPESAIRALAKVDITDGKTIAKRRKPLLRHHLAYQLSKLFAFFSAPVAPKNSSSTRSPVVSRRRVTFSPER